MRLIGYGYAPPTRDVRWCTDRLKIKPTNKILRDLVAKHGGVLVLTGSRFAESAARSGSLRKHAAVAPINPHRTIKGAWMWSPIRHVTHEELWEYLGLTSTPGVATTASCRTSTSRPTAANARLCSTKPASRTVTVGWAAGCASWSLS